MNRIVVLFLLIGFASFSQQKEPKIYENGSIRIKSLDFASLEPYLKLEDEDTYVVNFWATWCLPCVKELPFFEQINEKYKGKKVKVILVSLDMPNKIETSLIPFLI